MIFQPHMPGFMIDGPEDIPNPIEINNKEEALDLECAKRWSGDGFKLVIEDDFLMAKKMFKQFVVGRFK